jgi:hypothetical protein
MTSDARKRVTKGVPTGGQFAAENKHRTPLAPQGEDLDLHVDWVDGSKVWLENGKLESAGWLQNGVLYREDGSIVENAEATVKRLYKVVCPPPARLNFSGRADPYGFDTDDGICSFTGTKFDIHGYDNKGYDVNGRYYLENGFNLIRGHARKGFDGDGINRVTGTKFDIHGYDVGGFDEEYGRDPEGYDIYGHDVNGYNRRGFRRNGGANRDTGTEYDVEGFDEEGFNKEGERRKRTPTKKERENRQQGNPTTRKET